MSNKAYDILKKVSLMAVPLVTLITALTEIWGFQYGAEVCATISALGIFLGAALDISTRKYNQDMAEHADDPDEGRG